MIARFDGSRRHWSATAILLSAVVGGVALAGVVRAQVQPAQEPQAITTAKLADEPAQASDVKDVEKHGADEPATERKADNAPDEAGAKQAVRAEAGRDDAPGEGQATPPQPGDPAEIETHPQPHFPRYGPGGPPPGLIGSPPPVAGEAPGAAPRGGAAPPPSPGPLGAPRNAFAPAGAMMQGAGPFGVGGSVPGAQAPGQPQIATIEDAFAVKADAKTIEKLQRPMPIQVEGQTFEDVLNMLAQKGGFDILIDNRALGELNLIPNVQMNIREPQPIEQLLHFVLRQVGGDDIGFSVVHGVVMVSSKAALDRHVVTRVYDIRELGNPDDMQQTIEQTVGSNIAVRFVNGKMIVTTSEPNQREVAKLLAMLRQDGPRADATGGPAAETRVLKLKNIPAAAAAADAAGLKLGRGVRVESDPRTNEVIITGPNGDVVRAASVIIEGLDSRMPANPPAQGQPQQPAGRAFPLKGLTVGPGVKVTADERSNSLTVTQSGNKGSELEVIHRTDSAAPAPNPAPGTAPEPVNR